MAANDEYYQSQPLHSPMATGGRPFTSSATQPQTSYQPLMSPSPSSTRALLSPTSSTGASNTHSHVLRTSAIPNSNSAVEDHGLRRLTAASIAVSSNNQHSCIDSPGLSPITSIVPNTATVSQERRLISSSKSREVAARLPGREGGDPKLQCLDLASIHESVVKLGFYNGNDRAVGTGFFINIPDSPYEVILTAGHNLYTNSKTFMTQVTVLLPHPNPSSAEPYSIHIPAEHIKVSAEYQKDPTILKADYGVILVPYTGKKPRRGFGFNMMHTFSELRGEVNISSYRDRTTPGRPVPSTGVILTNESTEDQLVYEATTEKGNSGSPVWIVYNVDDIAVVAVHNHKPAPGSTGSRGSRISPKLLREVFAWASLDTTKKIKAQNISKRNSVKPPPEGLYMIFAQKPFARLRRGTGTEFDVLPAQVTANGIRYVLALGDKWVMFDTETQQAVLVDRLTEQSLFTKQGMKKPELNPHIVYIILDDKHQLRMDGSKFKPHDMPDAQTSGLSMITGQPVPFVHFTFEPYKPFTPLMTAADDPLGSACCPACGT